MQYLLVILCIIGGGYHFCYPPVLPQLKFSTGRNYFMFCNVIFYSKRSEKLHFFISIFIRILHILIFIHTFELLSSKIDFFLNFLRQLSAYKPLIYPSHRPSSPHMCSHDTLSNNFFTELSQDVACIRATWCTGAFARSTTVFI